MPQTITPEISTTVNFSPDAAEEKAPPDLCARLNDLALECRSISRLYRRALSEIAEHFASPYAAISISDPISALSDTVCPQGSDPKMWEPAVQAILLESQNDNVSIARLYGISEQSLRVAALAVPIRDTANRTIGAIALVTTADNRSLAKSFLAELSALVSLVSAYSTLIEPASSASPRMDTSAQQAIAKASGYDSPYELAFAITNNLKGKYGCDQVTLGQVNKMAVRVLSISGLDNVYPKSPGTIRIRHSMEECLDRGDVICCQLEDRWNEDKASATYRLHKKWHDEIGHASVASVPLHVGTKCVGIVSMSRDRKTPFTQEELEKIRETVNPFASALVLITKANRGLLQHGSDSAREATDWLFAARSWGRKITAVALLACVAWFCCAKMNYHMTVPSHVVPTSVQYLAAPFHGMIHASYVEVGDDVTEGQLLYEMDTADLELERARLESEVSVLRLKALELMTAEDTDEAALVGAEMRVQEAQLAVARHHIDGATIRAPADGTIVAGDVEKRVGEVVPMGEPLLEFVPQDDWSVELLVPESMIGDLRVGYTGRFASYARPDSPLTCEIVRIRPMSEPYNGQNVFIAEASVDGNPDWMLTGMEGYGRIEAGQRPIWWVALHRLINTLRLTFWF